MLVSKLVRFVGEWYPQEGVIILEFDTVFRRTSVGGVVFNIPPYLSRGCGIQRTPGDKATVEKRNKKHITGCACEGGLFYFDIDLVFV